MVSNKAKWNQTVYTKKFRVRFRLASSSNKNLPSGFLNLSKIEQNNVKKNSPAFKIFRLKAGLFRVQSNRKNNTRGRIKPVSRFLFPWESQSFQPARDL